MICAATLLPRLWMGMRRASQLYGVPREHSALERCSGATHAVRRVRSWRLYDQIRTDAGLPVRQARIGTGHLCSVATAATWRLASGRSARSSPTRHGRQEELRTLVNATGDPFAASELAEFTRQTSEDNFHDRDA